MRIAFPSSFGRSRSQNNLSLKYLVGAIRQGFSCLNLGRGDGHDTAKTGNFPSKSMGIQK
jgi:hypothetical protein